MSDENAVVTLDSFSLATLGAHMLYDEVNEISAQRVCDFLLKASMVMDDDTRLTLFINTPGGSVTLQDAFSNNLNSAAALGISQGTFDASTYNVTLSGASSAVSASGTGTRTVAVGSSFSSSLVGSAALLAALQ